MSVCRAQDIQKLLEIQGLVVRMANKQNLRRPAVDLKHANGVRVPEVLIPLALEKLLEFLVILRRTNGGSPFPKSASGSGIQISSTCVWTATPPPGRLLLSPSLPGPGAWAAGRGNPTAIAVITAANSNSVPMS